MFDYKFVRCPVIFGKAGKVDPTSYETIVREHATQGWRLVQLFIETPAAIPSEYVLIFERSQ